MNRKKKNEFKGQNHKINNLIGIWRKHNSNRKPKFQDKSKEEKKKIEKQFFIQHFKFYSHRVTECNSRVRLDGQNNCYFGIHIQS